MSSHTTNPSRRQLHYFAVLALLVVLLLGTTAGGLAQIDQPDGTTAVYLPLLMK